MLKRFLLFGDSCYYPGGGWEDFRGDYDSLDAAISAALEAAIQSNIDWCHVVDTETREMVYSKKRY